MSVQYLDIEESHDAGQRIDNYLMKILKGVPRQHVYKILRSGEVRINKGRVKPTYRLQVGDRIRIPPISTKQQLPVEFSSTSAEILRAAILYEDNDFIILNKPTGQAVHGGTSISSGIIEIMRVVTNNPRLELVHRLDRDTSGVLALAKKPSALKLAQHQFRQRSVKKIYEAFVWGLWPVKHKVVQLMLKRYETSWGERRVRVDTSGQQARTDFSILDQAEQCATRLQATLHTGRTHQIRVHTSATGHGIIGDDKYQEKPVLARGSGGLVSAARLCLHAKKLVIPLGSDTLKVTAPVPADMEAIWSTLKTS